MPKKIIIKPIEEEAKEEVKIEEEKKEETKEETIIVKEIKEEMKEETIELDEINKAYKEIENKINEIKLRDHVFQKLVRDEDINPKVIKKILLKWNDLKNQVLDDAKRIREKLIVTKSLIEDEFSKTEEDLYLATIEVNTMEIKIKEKGEARKVGRIEELEAKIPLLRQKLFQTRSKMKELDEKINFLNDLPKRINELTIATQIPSEIYEELKTRYGAIYGDKWEGILKGNIANIAESEGIPKEYATILVWKKLKSS